MDIHNKTRFWGLVTLSTVLFVVGLVLQLYLKRPEAENTIDAERLERKEHRVDRQLMRFSTKSLSWEELTWSERHTILLVFQQGQLVFWSDESVGSRRLYERLLICEGMITINHSIYDVRKLRVEDRDYFGLIFLYDDYPYTNRVIQNSFNSSLGNVQYTASFYLLILVYFSFFISLLWSYRLFLKRTASARNRQWAILLMPMILWVTKVMMFSVYTGSFSMSTLFSIHVSTHPFYTEMVIWNLFTTFLCVLGYCSQTGRFLEPLNPAKVSRYKVGLLTLLSALPYIYAFLYGKALTDLINNTEVSLNLAQLLNLDFASVTAFLSLLVGGLGIVALMVGIVRLLRNLYKPRAMALMLTIVACVGMAGAAIWNDWVDYWQILVLWAMNMLFFVSIYFLESRPELQRTISIVIMLSLSFYMIFAAKEREYAREMTIRSDYATELIQERDPLFETKLSEFDKLVVDSPRVPLLVLNANEEQLATYINGDLLDLAGYPYRISISLCNPEDRLTSSKVRGVWGCNEFYDALVSGFGVKIGETNYYSITRFDGVISYLGVYHYEFQTGPIRLYISFDSSNEAMEGIGYAPLLSRVTTEKRRGNYPYSYAKYREGVLVASSGRCNYPSFLENSVFKTTYTTEVAGDDGYSHLITPVGSSAVFVISLPLNVFMAYDINLFYAFFVLFILALYTNLIMGKRAAPLKGTIQLRLQNTLTMIVGVMLVLVVYFSIRINMVSIRTRLDTSIDATAFQLSKELEQYNCVETAYCPDILISLARMRNAVGMGVNIYSVDGRLASTSRQAVFDNGLVGTLLNPKAYEALAVEGKNRLLQTEKVGRLNYTSAYYPLVLRNGRRFILNVLYFPRSDGSEVEVMTTLIIGINILIVGIIMAFIILGFAIERLTKPLQLLNDKFRVVNVGARNEKIDYPQNNEVGALIRQYNEMVDKLDESARLLALSERESAWREMASQIAHEIKNPLTPMKLNVQFMQRAVRGESLEQIRLRVDKISEMLVEQIDQLAYIASAFSDFSKITAGRCVPIDLTLLVNQMYPLFEHNVDELKIEAEEAVFVSGTQEQLNRVLMNIIKNAIQSIPERKVSRIEVSLHRIENYMVQISVRDNGVGIPRELHEKIFEPKFTTKNSGMGLGLGICKSIVTTMGGTLSLESVVGEGTVFYVRLPELEPSEDSEEKSAFTE